MAIFTQDSIDFFAELEQHNDKAWFEQNKKRYEKSVKAPMKELAAELIQRMQAIDPLITMTPNESVFRLHRDTRFSKDKTPYKTNAALIVSRGKRGDHTTPGIYFSYGARGLSIASGLYMLEPAQVHAVRSRIVANLGEFERLIADSGFVEKFGEIQGEKNKIIPPEFREAAAKQPLVFNKQFFFWKELPPSELLREDLPDLVMSYYNSGKALTDFLWVAISEQG